MPVENPFEDFHGAILVRIEDENAKFNLNTIVFANGRLNETAYLTFQRLLKELSLDVKIADRVADWIDPDREQRLRDSETGARNTPLLSTDELSLIPGIEKDGYTSLLPHVTVFGDGLVNVNGADKPVLKSLHPEITDDLAARVIEYRRIKPFEQREDILKVAGFETTIGQALMGRIAVQGTSFTIRANAESDGIKRIIESVVDASGTVRYWKEY
jgi:general secretion pathway protein K